jgi:hypothetical protein
VGTPSVHPTVPRVSPSEATHPTIAPTLAIEGRSVHPTVSFLFLFLLGFDPRKLDYLLNLSYDILASLEPRNVYKDMLNNMISSNDHIVMNHQNQTRTNDIWAMFGTGRNGRLFERRAPTIRYSK